MMHRQCTIDAIERRPGADLKHASHGRGSGPIIHGRRRAIT
jgi:hypothetical protein